MHSCHPLAGVARWTNERELHIGVDLLGMDAPEPAGGEWTRLDRVPARVPELIATLVERSCRGHRTSAAAFLAGDIGRQVLAFAATSAYLAGRAPDLSAHRLWIRHDDTGRLDRLALRQGTVAVLPGDPMARRPGVLPMDGDDDLDHWFVDTAVATLEPVLEAVREHTRFGTRPQWSMVADAPHSALLLAANEVGADQSAAWDRAARMVHRINHDRPRVTPRQRPFALPLATLPEHRPERVFLVRGGCCFYFRFGDRPCTSCPLLTDHDREHILRAHYEPSTTTAARSR